MHLIELVAFFALWMRKWEGGFVLYVSILLYVYLRFSDSFPSICRVCGAGALFGGLLHPLVLFFGLTMRFTRPNGRDGSGFFQTT